MNKGVHINWLLVSPMSWEERRNCFFFEAMQKHAHFPPYLYQEKSFTLTCLEYGYMCINEYILLETFSNCTLSLTYMVWKDCIHFIQTQHTVYQRDHLGSVCVHYRSTHITLYFWYYDSVFTSVSCISTLIFFYI